MKNTYFEKILRDVYLFWKGPIAYLYTFTYSTEKKIQILPYDPTVTKLGEKLVKKIKNKFPQLPILFYGSARLKIDGQRDIELMAESKPHNFHLYVNGLNKIFGKPDKIRSEFIEWHIEIKGCTVELLLINPKNRIFTDPKKSFERLSNNKKLLEKYKKLKKDLNGSSEREYKKQRMEFFYRDLKV